MCYLQCKGPPSQFCLTHVLNILSICLKKTFIIELRVSYMGQQHLNPDSIYNFTQWSDKRVNRLLYIQKTLRIKKRYKLHIWTENKWIFSSLASSCCIFRILFPFPPWWGLSKRRLSSKPIEPSKIVLQFRNGEKQTLQMKLCSLFCHEQGCYKRASKVTATISGL